jgi:xylulokinase
MRPDADCVIAYDLGTGGLKAALVQADGTILGESLQPYETVYPADARHEQRPEDWWNAILHGTRMLLAKTAVDPARIKAIAISGHSLGCLPLTADGTLLQDLVPIWSDGRATEEAADFFAQFPEEEWYSLTGNGFPPPLYPIFKLLWLRRNRPAIFAKTATVLGTKDYINFRLTNRIATDHSYASGSGFYALESRDYSPRILAAAGLDIALLPPIRPASDVLGTLQPEIAAQLGLSSAAKVMLGGVDNSCMALGAQTFGEGDIFLAMGSSSWLTVSSAKPILDARYRPYVFDHVVPGMFISATSIFSSGTTLDWVRRLVLPESADAVSGHQPFEDLARESPPGARGLLLLPTLGGGTSLEGGSAVRGAFVGLDLLHDRRDIARAAYEGIALSLRVALDELCRLSDVGERITMVGGGARSAFWRALMADILGKTMVKTAIDQQAAALGAAGIALVGAGLWPDFSPIRSLHRIEDESVPDVRTGSFYGQVLAAYRVAIENSKALALPLAALRAGGVAP